MLQSRRSRIIRRGRVMLDIEILGPLEVSLSGKPLVWTAAKPRQVLALLALRAGEVVSVPNLIEEIWEENPPRSAITTLQTYILQLRRLIDGNSFPGAAKHILVTRYNGYMFATDSVTVDVQTYQKLTDAAHHAWEEGNYQEVSGLAREALGLWSGQVLIDVQKGAFLEVEATFLEQSRIGLLEIRVDAELRLGRHQGLLGELAVLCARNPMHENLCALFIIALYRSGQQGRALEVFKQLRTVLARELGVEPSARLQRLQHSILSADPKLDLPGSRIAG
ncbi:MAG: transcriptional regulator, family [Glaciihabitans sp.]|nr:transcriptional regulator, family [Glaciihabitans sp.]